MIEKIFEKFLRKRKKRPFSAWQIELTTRCPLQCKMCIRRENAEWQNQDMALEDFKKLLPYLREVESVVLEGWGESLLHKDLSECIRFAKKEGPRVGFVTSGKGLTKDRVSELIQAGLDFIGFSIAGTTPETHDAIRVNSHLPEILNAIRLFHEEKKRQTLLRPKMHLVYLMVKDNIEEVPSVPSFAKEAGIEEVALTNICHTINAWQERERVFVWESVRNKYEDVVRQAEANGRKLSIRVKRPSLSAIDVPVCEENPLKNLYISADGKVSPCVYLHPPLASPFKRIFCGTEYRVEKVDFGDIFEKSFPEIWEDQRYVRFRDLFMERQKTIRESYLSLWDSPKMKKIDEPSLPEPPASCRTCHKILGI
ncbi:MAG TPA: radical SAM protein [Thermodesulfobacteriota bacterium]|nr:radical SAM protein [Thermodesulfobacteriota bacterium]